MLVGSLRRRTHSSNRRASLLQVDWPTQGEIYRGDFQFSGVDRELAVDGSESETLYSPASDSSSFSCAVAGPDDIDRRRGGDELPGGGRSVISIAPLRPDAPPLGDALPAVRDADCVASVAGMPRNRFFRLVLPGDRKSTRLNSSH